MMTEMNDLMALMPQNAGAKQKIEFGAPKSIDGVELMTYTSRSTWTRTIPRPRRPNSFWE